MISKDTCDEDLLCLFQQGSEAAFEVLYNRYWERMLTIAYYRIGCVETAKGLVQDVFANLWQRREQLAIKTTFVIYLSSAMRYAVLDHIRSQVVQEKYVAAIKKAAQQVDDTTLESIEYRELTQVLNQEIGKLPAKCQTVFRLSRVDHHSNQEIAKQLNISPKTVENHLTKALKILRISLQEFMVFLLSIIFLPH
ncbi:RNA polymerase sigma-70 factor [Tunicatimonas pelagia]|uniref:RNA polymerase sigma-70 factor n=1 Tax=Tunicatimonas pelagia TaxID=931531 RepID=UPI0026652A2F|nr:RNA polymerase sigma-70 factor [Tunicatimonas pelagia]WKN42621.1 RNA polymerase sigma-70 factor [Tunicatimonas pelagia]